MSHGWGGMPDESEDYEGYGSSTNLLTTTDHALDPGSVVRTPGMN